ncbi:MAG: SDR family oxidoreductase [Saprospiraceae bacterium]|nr:SDR family oxidoreductase [Saprospiraceae bacterium]
MAQTVLITGTSSGIGKAAVLEFAKQGWNVAATMRSPEKETDFATWPNVRLYALDVTDNESIQQALSAVKKDFGQLDVVVNNAGYGLDGVFEAMTDDDIKKQFDTNVFGLMRVTREAIKLMRGQRGGKIIQIASMGGRLAFPLFSIYHASKWAVEGFTESLHYELLPFNIQLKLIEPGLIKTEFTGSSRHFVKPAHDDAYDGYLAKFEKAADDAMKNAENPEKVAKTIVKAAQDNSRKMRYPVGSPAPLLLLLKRLIPDTWFFKMIRSTYKI